MWKVYIVELWFGWEVMFRNFWLKNSFMNGFYICDVNVDDSFVFKDLMVYRIDLRKCVIYIIRFDFCSICFLL